MAKETTELSVNIDASVSPEAKELLAAGIPRWRSLLVWTVQLVGLAVSLIGTADVMNAINVFRPDVATWLSVSGVVLRLGIEPFVLLFGDLIDDGVRNNSFRLGLVMLPFLALLCLLLPGCGSQGTASWNVTDGFKFGISAPVIYGK